MSLGRAIQQYVDSDLIILHGIRDHYQSLSLMEAIEQASIGQLPNGKMDPHQWRVGRKKGRMGAEKLIRKYEALEACESFEELFIITEEIRRSTIGLGPLWSYDTALRIGFQKKVYPLEVYVQRGVVDGVKKIYKRYLRNEKRPVRRSIPLSRFPKEMYLLKPYEAENFLCIWGKVD